MKEYTIILADDHALMREGIRNLIESVEGLKVIDEVGDGLQLLKLVKKTPADMVILDISMPGMRGIEATREILHLSPQINILIVSMHKREEFLAMALDAGAQGYLLKEDSSDELLEAIDCIRRGHTYLSKKMAHEFSSTIISICRGGQGFHKEELTSRERHVLKLIAEGHTDRKISEKLCISVRTVHRHHANIRSKLNLKHTAELVRYAISQGYVEDLPLPSSTDSR
jgi:DNA-binding NarL/FixJ family response regulator